MITAEVCNTADTLRWAGGGTRPVVWPGDDPSRSGTPHQLSVRPDGRGAPARRPAPAGSALPDADQRVLADGAPRAALRQLAAGCVRQPPGPVRVPRAGLRADRRGQPG